MSHPEVEKSAANVPALYVITVDGWLDPDWSPRLGGLQIEPSESEKDANSRLTGWLKDQSALHGVLATLNSLSLSIIAVERVQTSASTRDEKP